MNYSTRMLFGVLILLSTSWFSLSFAQESNSILIEVRDSVSNALLPSAMIKIKSGSEYSQKVQWVAPSYSWRHDGFKSYTFDTSSTGYNSEKIKLKVNESTRLITLLLSKNSTTTGSPIPIQVRECVSGDSISSATITVNGGVQTINHQNGSSFFTPFNGFTSYNFTIESMNYLKTSSKISITDSTSLIVLCVNYRPINFILNSCQQPSTLLNGGSVTVTSSHYSSYSFSFTYSSSGTTWTPVGYQGVYTFDVKSPTSSYTSKVVSQNISSSTNEIRICLNEPSGLQRYCGDGICTGTETAMPTSTSRCFDCGRIRGVVSLAVGQKDQLSNITVSVWADPVNPALYLRNGSSLPGPTYRTTTNSKGYFAINTLSFDAPPESRGTSETKRRFYFSLEGTYKERTGSVETVTPLLPLWWNFELTNNQWSGGGNPINTNNSPTLFFYMTPGFSSSEALVRVILSWGTLISNPSSSLPDLDLVVAGPIDNQSIQVFGTGIVNFQTKDSHQSSNNVLPYARLVSDTTQGFGSEVMDFYGKPTTSSNSPLSLGFSSTYAPGSVANAYEVWVDRPNSSPNMDSVFTFLYDTNSFIVVYQNDGKSGGNKQVLFDQITNVPYTFGFYNGDQWNKVPSTATLWHVFDLTQRAPGFVFNGFPGENNTNDQTLQPGAKYGFEGQFFESTKKIPCGHVTGRGANPAYCPAQLTYPQI